MKIELKRLDDAFHFEAISETGNVAQMDAGENIGGHNKGVRPMQMLLMGLGGCSAIARGHARALAKRVGALFKRAHQLGRLSFSDG